MSIEKKEPKKTSKRAIAPAREKRAFEIANNSLIEIYDTTISMLLEGIRKGATDAPLGLLSLMLYADLLHGGSYTVPIQSRPYYLADPTQSKYYQGKIINTQASEGFIGWLLGNLGITNPGPLAQEVIIDSNVPHVFPKLISDEAYSYFMTVFGYIASTDIFKSAGTGVNTFVEAAAKATKAGTEAMNAMKPTEADIKTLDSLLKLLPAAGAVL